MWLTVARLQRTVNHLVIDIWTVGQFNRARRRPIIWAVELLATTIGDDKVQVTLADGAGLIGLAGAPDEIVALCEAMDEAALLARASERPAWLRDVRVGSDVVRLGVGGGRVRLVVGPAG